MSTWINPYLTFRNTAAEAMTFYQSVFGGDLQTMTFGQGGGSDDPAKVDLLMHAHLETTDGWTFMASDAAEHDPRDVDARPVTLTIGGTEDELDRITGWFDALAEGGEVSHPLQKQLWGDVFGQVRDRFGINWMVNIAAGGTPE